MHPSILNRYTKQFLCYLPCMFPCFLLCLHRFTFSVLYQLQMLHASLFSSMHSCYFLMVNQTQNDHKHGKQCMFLQLQSICINCVITNRML